jgi:predicted translation initiation factor SUI1
MRQRQQKTVLFLCTGNYYRSRFAEVLFNSVADRMGLPWRASFRGLALERGISNIGPMAASAVQALEALGVRAGDAITRLPTQVTTGDLEAAALIVALKLAEHLPLLQERFPTWAEKVEFWRIDDAPEVLGLIEQEVMGLVARLLGGVRRPPSEPTEAVPASPPVKEPAKKLITLKVGRETTSRRGKGVTTVFDAPLDENGLKQLAALLKRRCGTGGTVKDRRIEIQGDQRERIVAELERLGYEVKRVWVIRRPGSHTLSQAAVPAVKGGASTVRRTRARVVAVGDDALLLLTFAKPDALPDEAFRMGMRLLDEERDTLKRLLESEQWPKLLVGRLS